MFQYLRGRINEAKQKNVTYKANKLFIKCIPKYIICYWLFSQCVLYANSHNITRLYIQLVHLRRVFVSTAGMKRYKCMWYNIIGITLFWTVTYGYRRLITPFNVCSGLTIPWPKQIKTELNLPPCQLNTFKQFPFSPNNLFLHVQFISFCSYIYMITKNIINFTFVLCSVHATLGQFYFIKTFRNIASVVYEKIQQTKSCMVLWII